MSATYEKAPEVDELLMRIIKKWHPDIINARFYTTKLLINTDCEPGSEVCPLSCKYRIAATAPTEEYRQITECMIGDEEIIGTASIAQTG